MEELNSIVQIIALTMGVAWASGINLYAALLVLGVLGASGNMVLPPGLQLLTSPLVLSASGFMFIVEFIADKTPGVDTGWDALHSFIRIPAGAVLAATAVGEVDPAFSLAAAIIGGSLTAVSHVTKAGTRVLINASPEPFSNWFASLTEDAAVIGGLLLALYHPWVFLFLLFVFLLMAAWLLPRVISGIRHLFSFAGRLFRRSDSSSPAG